LASESSTSRPSAGGPEQRTDLSGFFLEGGLGISRPIGEGGLVEAGVGGRLLALSGDRGGVNIEKTKTTFFLATRIGVFF
jgi:hypothetical protein